MGTNVALDLDERPMPKGPIFPRCVLGNGDVLLFDAHWLSADDEDGARGDLRPQRHECTTPYTLISVTYLLHNRTIPCTTSCIPVTSLPVDPASLSRL